jgi:hypothetical protein
MRTKFLLAILLLASKFSFSQVSESAVMIDSTSKSAVYFETDIPESDVKDAIKSYFDSLNVNMEKTGLFKKQLPYMEFKNAVATNMSGNALDYYFKIDTRKQKGPDATTVYIAASKGYNNFLVSSAEDAAWNNFKAFAEFLRSNYLQQYRLKQNIADVKKQWKKDNDKLNDLLKDKTKLESNIDDENKKMADLAAQLQTLQAAVK